jgi:hypothetical protein
VVYETCFLPTSTGSMELGSGSDQPQILASRGFRQPRGNGHRAKSGGLKRLKTWWNFHVDCCIVLMEGQNPTKIAGNYFSDPCEDWRERERERDLFGRFHTWSYLSKREAIDINSSLRNQVWDWKAEHVFGWNDQHYPRHSWSEDKFLHVADPKTSVIRGLVKSRTTIYWQ